MYFLENVKFYEKPWTVSEKSAEGTKTQNRNLPSKRRPVKASIYAVELLAFSGALARDTKTQYNSEQTWTVYSEHAQANNHNTYQSGGRQRAEFGAWLPNGYPAVTQWLMVTQLWQYIESIIWHFNKPLNHMK